MIIDYKFTQRDIAIIEGLALSKTIKEIANDLNISKWTVYNRLTIILGVMDSNKYDLVDKARRFGVLVSNTAIAVAPEIAQNEA